MDNDIKQKAQGLADQAKGKIKQQSDDLKTKTEGYLDEAEGKIEEKSVDLGED